ncbi:MAG: ABC transporter permease subunit [Myxococcales bacterium]|nr:ABC transporter permease subunit [Myxococcales bacterium]
MMRWNIVGIIARKELLEALRDRKTLILMILVPILLYPALLLLITQVAAVQQQQLESNASWVGVLGGTETHPLVRSMRADPDLDVHLLPDEVPAEVFDAEPTAATPPDAASQGVAQPDAAAPPAGSADTAVGSTAATSGSGVDADEGSSAALADPLAFANDRNRDPTEFDRQLAAVHMDAEVFVYLNDWPDTLEQLPGNIAFTYRSIDEASRLATERVEGNFERWSSQETLARLEAANVPIDTLRPVRVLRTDLANTEQRGGFLLGALLPLFIIMTVLMGALYPAIDLTAGERERGSIQTLFTAPISPVEILTGKYLTVLIISLISGMANLLSLTLVFSQGMLLEPQLAERFDFGLSPGDLFGLFLCIVLIAVMVSAVLLAVAAVAPSFKDAQSYVTPVYLLCLIPATLAQMPGFTYTPTLALVPAVNIVLLMKQVLIEGLHLSSLLPVATSSLAYAAIILVLAARMFADESLVTGTGKGFAMLMPRRDIKPAAWPAASDAIVWFCVAFILMYYVGAVIQTRSPQLGLIATLWGVLLLPTVLIAIRLRLNFRQTFQLNRAPWQGWTAALLMGLGASIVLSLGIHWLESTFLPMSDDMKQEMSRQMAEFFPKPENALQWASLLFIGAFSPAICEELLFRGFILQGLRGSVRPWVAVVVTAVLFGLLHMSIYRLAGTTALGVIMGFLVLRTGSIYPAMLFHFVNNALALTFAMVFDAETVVGTDVSYVWLVPGAIAFVAGLVLMLRTRPSGDDQLPETPGAANN